MISALVFRAVLLTIITVGLAGAVQLGGVAGRVTDVQGNPLADVRVMSLPWEDRKTDDTGRFVLEKPAPVIRFSKLGYRPVTAATSSERLDIVLEPSTQLAWSPPTCSPARLRRFGETMMFTAPLGARLSPTADADYRSVTFRFRGSSLEFGTGAHWTNGLPVVRVLEAMVLVQERDVDTPWGDPAAEYRGVRRNGESGFPFVVDSSSDGGAWAGVGRTDYVKLK